MDLRAREVRAEAERVEGRLQGEGHTDSDTGAYLLRIRSDLYLKQSETATSTLRAGLALRKQQRTDHGTSGGMTRAQLAAALRSMREAAKISQADLGRKVGRPSSTVSRMESGELTPDIELISAWCKACGRTLELRFQTPDEQQEGRKIVNLGSLPPSLLSAVGGLLGLLQMTPPNLWGDAEAAVADCHRTFYRKHRSELHKHSPPLWTAHFMGFLDALRQAGQAVETLELPEMQERLQDAFLARGAEILRDSPFEVHPSWTPRLAMEKLAFLKDEPDGAAVEEIVREMLRSPPDAER